MLGRRGLSKLESEEVCVKVSWRHHRLHFASWSKNFQKKVFSEGHKSTDFGAGWEPFCVEWNFETPQKKLKFNAANWSPKENLTWC